MRHRFLVALALSAVIAPAVVAEAKTLKLPDGAPAVMFDVPDNWIVNSTALGLELMPPDKSAFLVAGIVKRDRAALTKWQADATRRMETFGIAFDPKVKDAGKVVTPTPPPTLFSGAPSIGLPEHGPQAATAFEDKAHEGLPLEVLTGRAPLRGAKLPFKALVLYGASYLGTPVDAQFFNFGLSSKDLFLLQQESGKTDERVGTIIASVRRPDQ